MFILRSVSTYPSDGLLLVLDGQVFHAQFLREFRAQALVTIIAARHTVPFYMHMC
jgi:hypothetical protein